MPLRLIAWLKSMSSPPTDTVARSDDVPIDQSTTCRVCGYDWGEPTWGPSGDSPRFDICLCCGVLEGYEDCSAETNSCLSDRMAGKGRATRPRPAGRRAHHRGAAEERAAGLRLTVRFAAWVS